MSMKTISFLEGENKIKIGQEVSLNNQDTEQWVWLMEYGIEVTQVNGDISLAIYKENMPIGDYMTGAAAEVLGGDQ